MTADESKLEILRQVEQGALSIEEGAHLLEILEGNPTKPEVAPAPGEEFAAIEPSTAPVPHEIPAAWKAAWSAILWLGVLFMGLTGYWLTSSYERSGMGVGFWFALVFLAFSCGIVWAGWKLLDSRWMVVHIRENTSYGAKNYSFWAPLPLQLVTWMFRTFGQYMPADIQARHFETIIQDLEQTMGQNEPFQVEVDGEEGSKAHINVQFS